LLPSNTPIRQLYPVLEAVVRDSTAEKRNDQVVKNLLKSENREVRYSKFKIEILAGKLRKTDARAIDHGEKQSGTYK
jgi:hypothetical protein